MANTSLYVVAAVLVLGYLLLGGNNDGGSSLDFGNELSVSRGGESQDLEYGDDLEAETEGDGEQGSDTSMIGGKYGCTVPSLRAVYGPELRNDLQQSAASKQGGFVETARVFISTPCASDKSDMVNMTQMAPRIFLSSQQGESINRCISDQPPMFFISMVDPDAPSREDPRMAEWLHWAVGNIPCPDFPEQKMPGIPMKSADLDVASSNVLMEYVGPSPPPGTGTHRYVLTLYIQQKGEMEFAPMGTARAKFDMEAYAQQHGLKKFASVFYTLQHCRWIAGMCLTEEEEI